MAVIDVGIERTLREVRRVLVIFTVMVCLIREAEER